MTKNGAYAPYFSAQSSGILSAELQPKTCHSGLGAPHNTRNAHNAQHQGNKEGIYVAA